MVGRGRLLADTTVTELTADGRSLEEAFFPLTRTAQNTGASPPPAEEAVLARLDFEDAGGIARHRDIRHHDLPDGRYGFRHAVRMEWIKLRGLRSTLWMLVATAAAMIAIGVTTMANTKAPGAADPASFDPMNNVLAGVVLGQLIIGVLAVLVMTNEYSSGSIKSTLAAVPGRPMVLAAKAAVFGVSPWWGEAAPS